MAKRLTLLLAALALLGVVVAGCGDDDSGSSNATDGAAEAMTEPGTDEEEMTGTGAEDGGGAAAPKGLEEAVERCKQAAKQSQQLSADTRANLERICEKAGSGDEAAARDAGREICEQIVRDSVPEGAPGLEEGLAACNQGE